MKVDRLLAYVFLQFMLFVSDLWTMPSYFSRLWAMFFVTSLSAASRFWICDGEEKHHRNQHMSNCNLHFYTSNFSATFLSKTFCIRLDAMDTMPTTSDAFLLHHMNGYTTGGHRGLFFSFETRDFVCVWEGGAFDGG